MPLIVKETPQLFMWFSDGTKIPSGMSPLPQNERLDYIRRLKEECAKLLITKTPVYLVYMGRLLNPHQKYQLEALQNESPNLAVIDYDDVEKHITDQKIIDKVAEDTRAYIEQEKLSVGKGGIADLVDFTRLVLLYNSNILRALAKDKISISLEWRQGLIYRDFDVTLKAEKMPNIPTTYGYMATLNFQEKMHEHHAHLIKLAKGNKTQISNINAFFEKNIYDLDAYKNNIQLFINRSLTQAGRTAWQSLISEYKEISSENNFTFFLIGCIKTENSFLAFNQDNHSLVKAMIEEVVNKKDSPYAAVQLHLSKAFGRLGHLKEFLTPQILGFNIGNDLTWKMAISEQHQSVNMIDNQCVNLSQLTNQLLYNPISAGMVNSSEVIENHFSKDSSKDLETVEKLSILSKNYLVHLNTYSSNSDLMGKDKLLEALNEILDNPAYNASTKLAEFSARLQIADKGILKKHREPHWVMFKKAALVLLGLTLVGAALGLADYAVRGHHSIFCSTKSHGERFVLDVEEVISDSNLPGTDISYS